MARQKDIIADEVVPEPNWGGDGQTEEEAKAEQVEQAKRRAKRRKIDGKANGDNGAVLEVTEVEPDELGKKDDEAREEGEVEP